MKTKSIVRLLELLMFFHAAYSFWVKDYASTFWLIGVLILLALQGIRRNTESADEVQ